MSHQSKTPINIEEISGEIVQHFQDSEHIEVQLVQLGFKNPQPIYQNLKIIRAEAAARFELILTTLLEALLASADPQMALNNFERFVACEENDKEGIFEWMGRFPESLYRLIVLFGGSRSLSHFLMSSPKQSLEYLSTTGLLRKSCKKSDLYRDLSEMVRGRTDAGEIKTTLRRFRKWEYARIVLRDLLRQADLEEITQEISDLADVCLQVAFEFSDRNLRKRYGTPTYQDVAGEIHPSLFSVIGMGKLGGRN